MLQYKISEQIFSGGNIGNVDNGVLSLLTGNAAVCLGVQAGVAHGGLRRGVPAWRVGKGGRAFLRRALAEGEEVDLHALEAAGDGDDLAQPAREGRHPDRLGVEVEPADLPPPRPASARSAGRRQPARFVGAGGGAGGPTSCIFSPSRASVLVKARER